VTTLPPRLQGHAFGARPPGPGRALGSGASIHQADCVYGRGCRAAGGRGGGDSLRSGRQLGPLPQARSRTGAVAAAFVPPHPSPGGPVPSRIPGDRACKSRQAVLLAPGIVSPRKDHSQERSLRSRPSNGAGATLECDLPRQRTGTYQEDGPKPTRLTLTVNDAHQSPLSRAASKHPFLR